MRYSVSKQDRKRGDRLFFIIQPVSLLPLYNASFSWHRGPTLKAEAQTILKRNIQRSLGVIRLNLGGLVFLMQGTPRLSAE